MPVPWNGQIASPPCASRIGGEPLGDLAERVVPADPLEPPLALGADAAQRVQQPVGRARVVEVAGDLGAQRAARERVVGAAAQPHGLAVAHRHDPAQPSGQSSGQAPGTSRSMLETLPPGGEDSDAATLLLSEDGQ